jgi:predicted 3-demethylubiquinone-9 3-methyltransferase (glyoxalase superfamily)
MRGIKQKITPHLWFDKEAKEAAAFHTSIFPDSKITSLTTLHDTPSGDCDVVSFERSAVHGHQRWAAVQVQSVGVVHPQLRSLQG